MKTLIVACSLVVVMGLMAANAVAQPAATPPKKAPPTAADFSKLYKQWEATRETLMGLQKEYSTAKPERQDAIIKEYNATVPKIMAIEAETEVAATLALVQIPAAREQAGQFLVSALSGKIQQDRYTEAIKLGSLLNQHKINDPIVVDAIGVAAYCTNDFATAEKALNAAKKAGSISPRGQQYLSLLPRYKKFWQEELAFRKKEASADDLPRVLFQTSKGNILIELFENEAPQTVGNFVSLVDKGYYNGLVFHRVLPAFMAQGGCPDGTGGGDPGYSIYSEFNAKNARKHFSGTFSMANAGPNTGGSQFFLTFLPTNHLNGKHTVFGRVIQGIEVLPKLQRRDPSRGGELPVPDKIIKATVQRKRNHVYQPTKVK